MQIKLKKVNREDGTRYCFVDPKGREWRIRRGNGDWVVMIPDGLSANRSTFEYTTLKELRDALGRLLQREENDERAVSDRQYIQKQIDRIPEELRELVQDGVSARAEFVEKTKEPGDLCYQVGWAYGLKADHLSYLASRTLLSIERIGLAEAIPHHRQYYQRQLLENHYRANSGSVFDNAMTELKRDVVSRYVEYLEDRCRRLEAAEKLDKPVCSKCGGTGVVAPGTYQEEECGCADTGDCSTCDHYIPRYGGDGSCQLGNDTKRSVCRYHSLADDQ